MQRAEQLTISMRNKMTQQNHNTQEALDDLLIKNKPHKLCTDKTEWAMYQGYQRAISDFRALAQPQPVNEELLGALESRPQWCKYQDDDRCIDIERFDKDVTAWGFIARKAVKNARETIARTEQKAGK